MALAQVRSTHPTNTNDTVLLGSLGHVTGLGWGFTCPGGADQMGCTLAKAGSLRHPALDAGRLLEITHGGTTVWHGQLLDSPPPGPGDAGWALLGQGAGRFGDNYVARYTQPWANQPDEALTLAVNRGLRWVTPSVNGVSGLYTGQQFDPASQTVTEML